MTIDKSVEAKEATKPKKLNADEIVKSFLVKGAITIIYEGENEEKISLHHAGADDKRMPY